MFKAKITVYYEIKDNNKMEKRTIVIRFLDDNVHWCKAFELDCDEWKMCIINPKAVIKTT